MELLLGCQVMKEKSRYNFVEAGKPEHRDSRRVIYTALPKPDASSGGIDFRASNAQGIAIDVEADDFGFRAGLPKHRGQCACSTTKVEDSFDGSWTDLIYETRAPCAFSREQRHGGVIEWRQPVDVGGWDEQVLDMRCHFSAHNALSRRATFASRERRSSAPSIAMRAEPPFSIRSSFG